MNRLDALGVKEKVIFMKHSVAEVVAAEIAAIIGVRLMGAVLLRPVLSNGSVKGVFKTKVKMLETVAMETLGNTNQTGTTGSTPTPLPHTMTRTVPSS